MKKVFLYITRKKDGVKRVNDSKKFAQEQFSQLLKKGLRFPVSLFHL